MRTLYQRPKYYAYAEANLKHSEWNYILSHYHNIIWYFYPKFLWLIDKADSETAKSLLTKYTYSEEVHYSTKIPQNFLKIRISSVQFSYSVMSNSLWPHGLQHTRLLGPSTTPRVYSNSCPLSRGWQPTISSSIIPFSSSLQSFPASGSFQMSQFFASSGQSIKILLQHKSFQWIFRTDFL